MYVKRITLSIILLLIIPAVFALIPTATCTDTDLANNIYSAGQVTVQSTDGKIKVIPDTCKRSTQLAQYTCKTPKQNTFYRWISSVLSTKTLTKCDFGCVNNACILPSVSHPLVAYWNFNEGNGTILNDRTNNSNTGTFIGNPTWTPDSVNGTALNFDGDDAIQIQKTTSVDLTQNITIEAYAKRLSDTDGIILSKNGPYFLAIRNNTAMGGIYANDGNCPVSCTTPGANTWTEVYGTTTLQQNTWYKLKLEYNGSTIKIYVNDVLEGSVIKTGQMPQVSQQIHLGWGEPGQNQYFTGIIDEVKIYELN